MALVGIAERSAHWLACASLTAICALGCAAGTPQPSAPSRDHWLSGYVFGIWGKAELDVRDDCPTTGAQSVRVGPTWSTLIVTVVTLGMYTPREVHVQCRARP